MRLASSRPAMYVGLLVLQCAAALTGLWTQHATGSLIGPWPAAGVGLAMLLVFGDRLWPVVLLGTAGALLAAGEAVLPALAMAAGQTAGAAMGAIAIERHLGGRAAFDHPQPAVQAALIVVCLTAPLEATLSVLPWAGASREAVVGLWALRWSASVAGTLVIAPAVIGIFHRSVGDEPVPWEIRVSLPKSHWASGLATGSLLTPIATLWLAAVAASFSRRQVGQTLLAVLVVGAACAVLAGAAGAGDPRYPFEWVVVPALLWTGFCTGRRGMSAAIVAMAVAAVWGTVEGGGPLARVAGDAGVRLVLAYCSGIAVVGLVLTGLAAERRRVQVELVTLSTSDALTGLGNYERLLDGLRAATEDADQAGRPFAVVFLDVDQLGTINDAEGYATGNRALCRVAEAIRSACRDTDLSARYGGDEFAVVVPQATEALGRAVCDRILASVAADRGKPALRVTGAVAVYPRDGASPTMLLRGAEALLAEARASAVTPPADAIEPAAIPAQLVPSSETAR